MGKKDAIAKKVLELGQDVLSGTAGCTTVDIDRFRARPQGPWGHVQCVRSERLSGRSLADLAVMPSGDACLLWEHSMINYRSMTVQIAGSRSEAAAWTLELGEQTSGTRKGRILGFNKCGVPVMEIRWGSGQPCTTHSMLFIGSTPLPHTRSVVEERTHVAWTMGHDGQPYCMRALGGQEWYQLVGYNPITGAETVISSRPGFHARDEEVLEALVISSTTYAVVSKASHEMGHGARVVTIQGFDLPHGRIVHLNGPESIARCGPNLWRIRPKDKCLDLVMAGEDPVAKKRHDLYQIAGYRRSLMLPSGHPSFIASLPHEQEGWRVDGHDQPAFSRVSDLFPVGEDWRYWAWADNTLFLMDLPGLPTAI